MLDQADKEHILFLASSSAPLDKSPKVNWVEKAGGLPPYVRKLARGIMKSGHDLSSAISIAISRIKVWAAGGGEVNADTRAKAVKALAQWEKAKAKSHVKLTNPDGEEYLALSAVSSFDTELVRVAWDSIQSERRVAYNKEHQITGSEYYDSGYHFQWIEELGTDYIIVKVNDDRGGSKEKIPYTVDDEQGVIFGPPVRIVQIWVEDPEGDGLTADELKGIGYIPTAAVALSHISDAYKSLKK